jgi:GIY-YIG catalytic domain
MTMGIYRLYNKVTGRSYIGMSNNIENRIKQHLTKLKNPKTKTSQKAHIRMHKDYKKYGIDSFAYEILEECSSPLKIYEREQYWMEKFDALNPEKSYHLDANKRKHPLAEPRTPSWYLEYEGVFARDIFGISMPAKPEIVFDYLAYLITKYGTIPDVRSAEDLCQRIVDLDKFLKVYNHKSPMRLEHLESVAPLIKEYVQLKEQIRKLYDQILNELGPVAGLSANENDTDS